MARPKGFKQTEEVKARIAQGVSSAHRARLPIHTERFRSLIKTGSLIKRLHSVGVGEVEASPVSVQACIALLRKTLPDLASVEHKHDAMVTLRTIITGVIRPEDLESSPSLTKTIDHIPSDCVTSSSNSVSSPPPTEEQAGQAADSASLIEKDRPAGGE